MKKKEILYITQPCDEQKKKTLENDLILLKKESTDKKRVFCFFVLYICFLEVRYFLLKLSSFQLKS